MDLVTQDSYEKRHKQSTIPPALAKEKEIKEEPIQKIQPRNYRKNTETTAKNNNCGFCGQQNWSPSHKCPAKTAECNNCHKMGHFARVCRSKTNKNTRKQKINYLEETYTEEEESEPEEIQQITQINRVLPDENDNYGIKLKINGKYQNFTIDTGSPVTIMPNNPELYNQRDIKPLKERYQDVNKNEIQFLGKIWADIEHNGKTTKLPILITKKNNMARTYDITRRNQTNKEKTDAINKLEPPTNAKALKSFLGDIQYFAKFIPNLSEKTDNMRQLLKKGTKWEWTTDRNSDFNKIKQELTSLHCLAHYNGNKENIVTTDACKTGLGIALWQKQGNGELKPIAFASRYLNDAEKKYSIGELELLAVVWGLERFRFHLYGKQVQLFSDHQALEPLLKRNKTNKQYSARLTRWLDRLNHFDICLKHTAGKEIKFTDFISRNPTENPESEENYEEEFVINAIAQLATVNARIGRIFDQSEDATTAAEANMRDTRSLIDTRRHQTNKSHIDSNYRIQQHSFNTDRIKMNNNENNTRFFRTDGQLRHHWGADDDIMAIINARDKSPETTELVRRRIQLARPGIMRPHFNKNLGRELYIP